MIYDFDKIIDRRDTNSLKYDFAQERGRPKDILPLWVADMDFRAPDEVVSVLKEKSEHGIFGYSEPKKEYFDALVHWFVKRHGWNPQADKFVLSCGVVYAICTLIRILTQEGDGVLICQPVYYPFEESIVANRRKLVVSRLVNDNGEYSVDFEDFERKITENGVKLFILCNPHNPVGRVWTKAELETMGDICLKHGVFVISDEIHSDFIAEGYTHTVFSTVKPSFEKNCAVCTAPTKTFNLAGLHIANIYIPDDAVRSEYKKELCRQGFSQSNVMGIVACQAAYSYGESWLEQLKAYLKGNVDYVKAFLREELPQIRLTEPQGTYLLWLDFSSYGFSNAALKKLIIEKAGLWLDDGYIFGAGGSGFERINIACPRAILKEAMRRLKRALE